MTALDIATRLAFLLGAIGFAVLAALGVGLAWITLTDRLEARRWAIRDRDTARRERELLDELAPGPDTDALAQGRDRLDAAIRADHLRDLVGDIAWPETEDPQ